MPTPPPVPPPIPPPPPAPLGYGTRYQVPFFSLRVSLLTWTFGIIVLAFMLFGVPKFEQIFKDFKTELPGVTKVLLAISRWAANDYGWLMMLPAIGVAPLGLGVLMAIGVRDQETYQWRKRWATLLLVTAMIAIAFLVLWSLMAPLLSMMQSISGGSSKK